MSIGFLKRLLSLTKLFALLVIAGAAYGYWDHSQAMADHTWSPPNFSPPVTRLDLRVAPIKDLSMRLGRFQRAVASTQPEVAEGPKLVIQQELDRLGVIRSAFVVYPPFDTVVPSIIFEFKQKPAGATETIRTIKLDEALLDRPHRESPLHRVPIAYKFVGCEPDQENPGWTYFLFDMKCDGTDIQKARWKLETDERAPLPDAEAGDPGLQEINKHGVFIGRTPPEEKKEEPKKTASPTKTEIQPVVPPPVRAEVDAGSIFDIENDTFQPTSEGVEYLKNNYQKILKDAVTQPYRDKSGRAAGVRVVNIRRNSAANAFGIRPDDVILAINDIPVSKQSQAVNIVKKELKKSGMRIIRVKILRNGREIEKRYDTRDPETRRRAKKAFR